MQPINADELTADCLHELPTGVCILDRGRLRYLNSAAARLLGITRSARERVHYLPDLAVAGDRLQVATALASEPDQPGIEHALEFRVAHPDGTTHTLCLCYQRQSIGNARATVGTLHDLTETKDQQERLQLTAAVFDNSLEGVVICDRDLQIQMVNPAFGVITGYHADEVIGRTPSILASGRQKPDFYREMWEMIELTGHWEGEIWNRRKNGEIYPEYLSISALKDDAGNVRNYVGVFTDISHRKLSDRQLHRLVHYDTLTDLPNRDMFRQLLKGRIVHARANRLRTAVVYIDIDRFKSINDSFGHSEGDNLLQLVAERMKNVLREGDVQRSSDVVARLAGDEFVVLVDGLQLPDHAGLVAQKLLQKIQEPISLGGLTLQISASIGIAMYPDDAENVDDLLRNADIAMYQAKQAGRGQYHYFTHELRARAQRQMQLRSALHDALEQGQFHLVYQPQLCASSQTIRCFEALLRWDNPGLGPVPPDEFIPLLEESGEIERVGRWVIEQAARQCVAWKKRSPGPLRVSVNLSARQLRTGQIVDDIADALARTRLPASCLELELTESLAMDDVRATQQLLASLCQLGVRVTIDDFGTGYSSLSYLQNLYLDALKVDRSFVHRCDRNPHDQAIIRATVALAHSMGLEVVAEGVETEAQQEFLASQGVDLVQGFLFSRPLNVEDAGTLIDRYNRVRSAAQPTVPEDDDIDGVLVPAFRR